MKRKIQKILFVSLLFPVLGKAAEVSEGALKKFQQNTKAVAADVNSNFEVLRQAINSVGGLGKSHDAPASSCADLLAKAPATPDGVYWLKTASAKDAFRAYCDMTTDGGGWTLVWSNLRGGSGKVTTKLAWGAAINTLPRFHGEPSVDLESFEVYTGLKYWAELAPSSFLRYVWSHDYGAGVDQSYRIPFSLDSSKNYTITFNITKGLGNTVPGLVSVHNGLAFSAFDSDHDTHSVSCSREFSDTPWWYQACWNGSINGGGEWGGTQEAGGALSNGTNLLFNSPHSAFNGAYWVGSEPAWGVSGGTGAGNGWIFVR